MGGCDAVDVGVDEELVICAVDGVVEDRAVEAELYAVLSAQVLVEDEGVTDLRGHGVVYTLVCAAFGHLRAVRVTEEDADADASLRFLCERALNAAVFGEEKAGVDQDADLFLGCGEETSPCVPWDGRAVRVDRHQFAAGRCRDLLVGESVRPKERLIYAQARSHCVAVSPVGVRSLVIHRSTVLGSTSIDSASVAMVKPCSSRAARRRSFGMHPSEIRDVLGRGQPYEDVMNTSSHVVISSPRSSAFSFS